MADDVGLLAMPRLRAKDVNHMPRLRQRMSGGEQSTLVPSFPAVTCPVQANMTTGVGPDRHGVIANGFFYRERGEFEMWTAWNECIESPQIWDVLHEPRPGVTSAAWFPLHIKGAGADYICTPAPIHNPDGTESLWCYTKPEPLYGELRDKLDHFPLHHFWGPLANIASSEWIVDSAIHAAGQYHPNFFYIYIPHLDYAPQKFGPDSALKRANFIHTAQLTDTHILTAKSNLFLGVGKDMDVNVQFHDSGKDQYLFVRVEGHTGVGYPLSQQICVGTPTV